MVPVVLHVPLSYPDETGSQTNSDIKMFLRKEGESWKLPDITSYNDYAHSAWANNDPAKKGTQLTFKSHASSNTAYEMYDIMLYNTNLTSSDLENQDKHIQGYFYNTKFL